MGQYLGFDAGDSNLYRYVNNAPTNATDPSGQQDVERLLRDSQVMDSFSDAQVKKLMALDGALDAKSTRLSELVPSDKNRLLGPLGSTEPRPQGSEKRAQALLIEARSRARKETGSTRRRR